MHFQIVGINHKSAPIGIREKVSFSAKELGSALRQLASSEAIAETLILSTCNRVELYSITGDLRQGFQSAVEFLCGFHKIENKYLKEHLYCLHDTHALRHLFRVVSSLDSMVVGETQIFGQVKDALAKAKESATIGKQLNKIFEEAIRVGKKARAETAIGKGAVSISSAAIALAKKIFGNLNNKKILIIGAGKIAELAVDNLYAKGVKTVIVANRTFDKAKELASLFGGQAVGFDQIFGCLQDADILISSTSAPHYIITYKHIAEAMKLRNHRTLFLIDLGLPRNISPEVSELEQVHLYNIDGLTSVCDANIRERLLEVKKVEQIIERRMARLEKELFSPQQEALSELVA